MTNIDYSKVYWKYNKDVLDSKIVAGKLIKLACQRMIDFAKRDDMYFDYEDVDRKIRFIHKMKMLKGLHAGEPFVMLPYQQWIVSNIFGWKYKSTDLRVTTNVLIMMARQQGKSYLCSALALCGLVCDNESCPEISFIANCKDQARILLEHCKGQCSTLDPKRKIFKTFRSNILCDQVRGRISILASDTSKLDGRSDSLFIQDECHAAKTNEIFDVLKTGQGSRKQPLAISCTTAGFLLGSQYPLYAQWENCCNILKGLVTDDSWFQAIYQLDEDDDWQDDNVWIKANPSLGVAVEKAFIRSQILTAKNNPHKETSVKTKNLNMWCQSENAWFTMEILDNMLKYKVDLADYAGCDAYMGIDLSKSSDLTAFAIMFPPDESRKENPDKFVFKTFTYIPDIALEKSPNKEFYRVWIKNGVARNTEGNVVDYDRILKDMIQVQKDVNLLAFGYDPWRSPLLVTEAEKEGLPMMPFKQGRANFTKVIEAFEMLANSGRIIIDGSPLVKWCFGNIMITEDHHENMLVEKANRNSNLKIDPVISMLEALGCYINDNGFNPQIYII